VPPDATRFIPTQATTILAFKFTGGVLVAGDRRATAGNTVVYDRADKVLEIARHSIMAIAGVPAQSAQVIRRAEARWRMRNSPKRVSGMISVPEILALWGGIRFETSPSVPLQFLEREGPRRVRCAHRSTFRGARSTPYGNP
jgi:hypothetical protein